MTKNKTPTLVDILNRQDRILDDLRVIKARMAVLGSLDRFEEVAKRGRKFAKEKGIKPSDVLRND